MKIKPVFKSKDKPKLTGELCAECAAPLNEYHRFFDRKKCGSCEPIYLLNSKPNEIRERRIK